VNWCFILLKLHLIEQVIIDMFQKVGQIILKKCKIVFRVQMLLKKIWIYDVISKNTCSNINRLSIVFEILDFFVNEDFDRNNNDNYVY